jgi:hypothetical protein
VPRASSATVPPPTPPPRRRMRRLPPYPHVADRPHAVRPRVARPPACPPLRRRRRAAASREGNFLRILFLIFGGCYLGAAEIIIYL